MWGTARFSQPRCGTFLGSSGSASSKLFTGRSSSLPKASLKLSPPGSDDLMDVDGVFGLEKWDEMGK
jgi:hypothetical protein